METQFFCFAFVGSAIAVNDVSGKAMDRTIHACEMSTTSMVCEQRREDSRVAEAVAKILVESRGSAPAGRDAELDKSCDAQGQMIRGLLERGDLTLRDVHLLPNFGEAPPLESLEQDPNDLWKAGSLARDVTDHEVVSTRDRGTKPFDDV